MFLDSVEITGSGTLNPPSHPMMGLGSPPSFPFKWCVIPTWCACKWTRPGSNPNSAACCSKGQSSRDECWWKGESCFVLEASDQGRWRNDVLRMSPSYQLGDKSFKGSGREGAAGGMFSTCSVLGLVDIKVKFWASPIFWFQLVWGLRACGHKFLPGGDLIPIKTTYQWL